MIKYFKYEIQHTLQSKSVLYFKSNIETNQWWQLSSDGAWITVNDYQTYWSHIEITKAEIESIQLERKMKQHLS